MKGIKKAIMHFEYVKRGAVAVLDSGFGTKPNECSIVYENRKLYAELAIKALEKQIPKKPIGRHTSYKCPICDRRVRSGKGSSSFGVDHFCQRCGQALDWSEQE